MTQKINRHIPSETQERDDRRMNYPAASYGVSTKDTHSRTKQALGN
jgi:hypothetical protein